jgi:hypothetical protein
MKTCVCQRNPRLVWSSKGGKSPTTDSSRSHHSRRNRNRNRLCSHNRGSLCSLCRHNRGSRSRELPG